MPFDATNFVETKPDVFSLEGLVAWLEKQNPETEYCYRDHGHCLAAQFNAACGRKYSVLETGTVFSLGAWFHGFGEFPRADAEHFPTALEAIAVNDKRTFGAALDRARKLLEARS